MPEGGKEENPNIFREQFQKLISIYNKNDPLL